MTARPPGFERESLAKHLKDTNPHITALRPAGTLGATLIDVLQPARDWSDPATPDLVIGCALRPHPSATCNVGGGRFRFAMAPPRSAVVVAPGFATTFLVDGPHAVRALVVPYRGLLGLASGLGGLLPTDGDFAHLHGGVIDDPALPAVLDAMWREAEGGSVHGTLFADAALLQVAAILLRLRDGRPPPVPSGGLAPWRLRRVQELLESRGGEDTGLTEIARDVGLSVAHLSRAFKASTGLPPWQWLVERRIERAKALLADPKLSLTHVAQLVGYSGQNTLGEAFKRVTGKTPGQYRLEVLE